MGTPGRRFAVHQARHDTCSHVDQQEGSLAFGTFGRGDFIGEMGFLDSERRSAEAIALTDTDCFVLSRDRFNDVAGEHGAASAYIFEGIASVLAMRLRFMNKEVRSLRA